MFDKKIFCILLLLLFVLPLSSREVTDTLYSERNDRVIITYEVLQSNGKVVVKFIDAKKKLGRVHAGKYKRLNEISVVFFERVGKFHDMKFVGLDIESFMVPANMSYRCSGDGYFLMSDCPTITMNVRSGTASILSIPMYLAHYEKKGQYAVFGRCGKLIVVPPKKQNRAVLMQDVTQITTQTVTSQEKMESTFSDADEAVILINKVTDLLGEQEEYPFSDELKHAISSLRDKGYRISDTRLSARINSVLGECKAKEDELKSNARAVDAAVAAETERKQKVAEAEALARQDSISNVAQCQAEKEKKRNMGMIIGGVLLAALAFIGNQAFQHFRNAKNQKNLISMQESMVKRAEGEARRRAQSMARNQAHKVQSQIKTKARNTVSNNIDKMTSIKSKKKKVSI